MAKTIVRKTLQLFGNSGPTGDFEQFGSTAAGTTVYTKDIATIQSLAAWLTGWRSAVLAQKAPTLQDMNAAMYVFAYELFYGLQEGIAEYDSATTYYVGSIVKNPSTFELYGSLIDANVGNALPTRTSNANWAYLCDLKSIQALSNYRRPNLIWSSVSTVSVEAGLNGTSGNIPMLFADGSLRTESSGTRTTFDITRNAVLTTAGAQSGLRSSLSEAANTWYALYAVKVTDSATQWCTVGDTLLPTQANYATLSSNFGTNGWVYLGLVRNGDNSTATTDLLTFSMSGHQTIFNNEAQGNTITFPGILLASSASASSLTYSYSAGTGTTQIPNNILMARFHVGSSAGSGTFVATPSGNSRAYFAAYGAATCVGNALVNVSSGLQTANGSATKQDIFLTGFIDTALGVGSNPLI